MLVAVPVASVTRDGIITHVVKNVTVSSFALTHARSLALVIAPHVGDHVRIAACTVSV